MPQLKKTLSKHFDQFGENWIMGWLTTYKKKKRKELWFGGGEGDGLSERTEEEPPFAPVDPPEGT